MVLVEEHQSFRSYGVRATLALYSDRRLQPTLFDPHMNLFFPNTQGAGQAFNGESIATNLSNAEMISCQHAPNRSGCPIEFFGNLFDRALCKLFTNTFYLILLPATMFDSALQNML